MRRVKTYGVLIKLMNQNFSKSKILHESSKLEHFHGGRLKCSGSANLGGGGFWTSQKFRFPTIIILVIFWTVGKNSPDYLVKKYGNIEHLLVFLAPNIFIGQLEKDTGRRASGVQYLSSADQ